MPTQLNRSELRTGDRIIVRSNSWVSQETIQHVMCSLRQLGDIGRVGYLILPHPWSFDVLHSDSWPDVEVELDCNGECVSILLDLSSEGVLSFSHQPEPFSTVRWHGESGSMELNKRQMFRLADEIRELACRMQD